MRRQGGLKEKHANMMEGTNNKNNLRDIAGNSSLRQHKHMKDLRSYEQTLHEIRCRLAHMHPVTLLELEQDKPCIWPGEIGWRQREHLLGHTNV